MKQWSVAKLNKERASSIAQNFDLPPIIATLLEIKGITSQEDIQNFLFEESRIDNPFEIMDMDKACERIKVSIENGEKICVYGDYDADGVTSTALLYSYLETVGANVMYYIPSRETEGYGMNINAIDALHKQDVKLIVTVDNGIAAIDEIDYANSLGIDTVVTDHHMPGDVLPNAVAVVDLHRSDCKSRFKLLSGVGVAFKLVMALEGEYGDLDTLLENYSDLVSLGTIGDIVHLVDENRVFVKRGLVNLANSDRVGISALIEQSGLADKELTAGNVSFTLVPRINAVGRLGLSQDSLSLLLTDDYDYAYEMACKLDEDNSERQKIEKDILNKINSLISENPQLVQDRVLIIDGEDWHQGVIGIVSSRIKDIYGKPCIVLSRNGDTCKGSGRSIDGFDLWEAVNSCSHLLTRYGGHTMAVGLGLDCDKIDEFRKAINRFAAEKEDMPFATLKIDCKLNPAFIDTNLAKQLRYLQPFGAGNSTPIFQLCNLKITNIVPVSNDKHLKIFFNGKNSFITAMKFFVSSAEFPYKIGDVVDIAVTLDVNEYKNSEYLSVIIKDIKFSDVDNLVYLESNRIFERFSIGEMLTDSEYLSLIPTRDDFALVYRYLRQRKYLSNLHLDVIIHRLQNSISYGKLRVIIYAMRDVGLIALNEDMKSLSIELLPVDGKVNFEDSALIKRLKEEYNNG